MNNILRRSACLFLSVFFGLLTYAQGIAGVWKGDLHVQPKDIPIVFHIGSDSSGKLIAAFDSPTQNAFGLAVSEIITKEDSVILMIAILDGKYAGVLGSDKKTIDGRWYQGKASLPLTITKTSDFAAVKQQRRPQTPRSPFPYQVRDVEYWNSDKSIRFGGTLTYPTEEHQVAGPDNSGKKVHPAVILITGSGQQDRDEMLVGHKPFAVIADNLTRRGYVVLRVDDRGMGKTTGDFNQATSLDFAKDVEAGLDFLEAQPEVDKEKIGLIGHSEGGLIAPIVAGERKEVKFIVLLAGPGIPSIDLMKQQAEATCLTLGWPPVEARSVGGLLHMIWEEINKKEDSATTYKNVRAGAKAWATTLDTATRTKIQKRFGGSLEAYLAQAMPSMTSKWYRYFIGFDPKPYLQKLQCKVLALNGGKDVQVLATPNLAGIKAALRQSRSPKYDVIELPGLNHLFQTCHTCSPPEYGDLEETFSPGALAVMDEWLVKNVR